MTNTREEMWQDANDNPSNPQALQLQVMLADTLNRIEEAEEYLRLVYVNPRYFETVQWKMAERTLDILAGHPDGADE